MHENIGASKPECIRTIPLRRELSRTWPQNSAQVSASGILHKVIEWYLHWHGLITARDFSFKDKWDVAGFLFLSKKVCGEQSQNVRNLCFSFLKKDKRLHLLFSLTVLTSAELLAVE